MIPVGNNSYQTLNRTTQNSVAFRGALISKIEVPSSDEPGKTGLKKIDIPTNSEYDQRAMSAIASYIKLQKPADLVVVNGNLHIKPKDNESEYTVSSFSNNEIRILRKKSGNKAVGTHELLVIKPSKGIFKKTPIPGASEFLVFLKDKIAELNVKNKKQPEIEEKKIQPKTEGERIQEEIKKAFLEGREPDIPKEPVNTRLRLPAEYYLS